MAELVDALDLKSNVRKSVPVRVRLVAPKYATPDRKLLAMPFFLRDFNYNGASNDLSLLMAGQTMIKSYSGVVYNKYFI